MNSELAHQMQHFVEHCSMQEVCKCVLGIGLTSRVSDMAIQHGLAYIVDRSRSIVLSNPQRCIQVDEGYEKMLVTRLS